MDSKINKLNEHIALAHLGGGQKRIDKQHEKRNSQQENVLTISWMKVLLKRLVLW